jgi:hypothetical protein
MLQVQIDIDLNIPVCYWFFLDSQFFPWIFFKNIPMETKS